jgi:hypothetical protein
MKKNEETRRSEAPDSRTFSKDQPRSARSKIIVQRRYEAVHGKTRGRRRTQLAVNVALHQPALIRKDRETSHELFYLKHFKDRTK